MSFRVRRLVNDTMNTSGTEIASARALILAFLTNSEDDQTADFAEQCLDALAKSDKLKHDAELSQGLTILEKLKQ